MMRTMKLIFLTLTLVLVAVSERHLVSGAAFTWQPSAGLDDFTLVSKEDALEAAYEITDISQQISISVVYLTMSLNGFMMAAQGEDPVDKWNAAIGGLSTLALVARNGSQVVTDGITGIMNAINSDQDNMGVAIDRQLQSCEPAMSRMLEATDAALKALEDLLPAQSGQDFTINAKLGGVGQLKSFLDKITEAFVRLIQNVGL